MSGVRIRLAAVADIPEMHRVRVSVRENRLGDPSRVRQQDYMTLLEGGGAAWVAEADGRVVAFAAADAARANVWALFVEPGFEGRGLGRRLHDTMLEWLFDTGAEVVWLSTDAGTRAERFYASAGWRAVGQEPNGELRFEISRREWRGGSGGFGREDFVGAG